MDDYGWQCLADALRDRPNQWTVALRGEEEVVIHRTAVAVHDGSLPGFSPSGAFEAASRPEDGGCLYVRYVGVESVVRHAVEAAERLLWVANHNRERALGTASRNYCLLCCSHATFYNACSCGLTRPVSFCHHCRESATTTHPCDCGFV
jgi:hypothetical protein